MLFVKFDDRLLYEPTVLEVPLHEPTLLLKWDTS